LIQYDDAYSPPKAVAQVRKLVERDEVLFTFQIIGTPSNAAVEKYLNARKVPQAVRLDRRIALLGSAKHALDDRVQSQLPVRGTHLR
jgi:hypothetical protein